MTHLVDFLDFRLPSQGLNTGSNPVGTTTVYVSSGIVLKPRAWQPYGLKFQSS